MKKFLVSAGLLASTIMSVNAQNTSNTLPITGDVGLGLTNPDHKLHIKGGDMLIEESGSNEDADLLLRNKLGYAVDLWVDTPSNDALLQTYRSGGGATHSLILGGGHWEQTLFVVPGRKVGISTKNVPEGYKLAVDGKVICEEMKVALSQNWGDFVFNKDYELMPLESVEDYITENSHLPNIPSATEVEEEGLELGEMQRLQMIKIEELTLHLIEMKKEIDSLKAELLVK